MSDQDFLRRCDALLDQIEDSLDALDLDVDFERSGHVLEVTFDDDARLVVNGQEPMREIWLASPGGAHHFRRADDGWVDTRSGESLSAVLSRAVSRHAGRSVVIALD